MWKKSRSVTIGMEIEEGGVLVFKLGIRVCERGKGVTESYLFD